MTQSFALRRNTGSIISSFVLALSLISSAGADSKINFESFNQEQALAYSQSAIGRPLEDHVLTVSTGKEINLDQFRGNPLVISLVYTSCHHVCPVITKSLAHTVSVGREALGKDSFNVLTIGFDTENDTPDRMRYFAKSQGVDDNNWYFLSADAETISSLSSNLGFIFFPSSKGFDHLSQTTIVDSNGNIYRQVYGTKLESVQIVEPLKELRFGNGKVMPVSLADWINNIKLFCTIYDPASDRYRFDYSIFMAILIGLICLGSILVFLIHAWRVNRASKPAH